LDYLFGTHTFPIQVKEDEPLGFDLKIEEFPKNILGNPEITYPGQKKKIL